MTTEAVKVVEAFYEAFAAGDLEGCLALLSENCVLEAAGGMPYSGTFVGVDGFVAQAGAMARLFSRAEPVDWQIVDAGEIVVAQSTGTFSSRADGMTVSTPVAEHYWVMDGKITRIDVYYKDPKSLRPLFA
jgi:ketosteroid isomerase-like protein